MGLGLATLIPDQGTPILSVADVDGVTLAGLLLEAGPTSSPTLLELGSPGSSADHSAAPDRPVRRALPRRAARTSGRRAAASR